MSGIAPEPPVPASRNGLQSRVAPTMRTTSVIRSQGGDAMKPKKSSRKGKPSDKRSVKDLPPSKTQDAKGAMLSSLAQMRHDAVKGIVENFRA